MLVEKLVALALCKLPITVTIPVPELGDTEITSYEDLSGLDELVPVASI